MKKVFPLVIGILIGLAMQASATAGTNLVLDYNNTGVDVNLRPGDSGILTLLIKNSGGYQAESIELWIPDTKNIHAAKRWYIGNIGAGSSTSLSTLISVDKDARIGLYTLQAQMNYDGLKSDGSRENDKSTTWNIPIRIYGDANFQISVGDVEYTEDTTEKLTVNLNPEVDVRKATSTLTSSCASIVGSGKQYLGDISAGKDYSVEYVIRPDDVGICSLSMLLEYYDASGTMTTENRTIGINVERSSIDLKVVDIEDGSLNLGGVSGITLKLKNLGNTVASDVTVTLNLSSPFTPVKSSQKYVGDIKSGETVDAAFTVSVDSSAEKKSYSIPVTVEYYDQAGSKHTTSINIGLSVGGNADIKVNLDERRTLIPGLEGSVTIGVINRGFVDAKFLTLKLLSTGDYQVVSSDSSYIGALNSDDSDSEDFEIKVYDNVTKERIPLKVRVEYKEENNDKLLVKDETIEVSLTSSGEYMAQQSGGGILSLIFGLVGVVIVLVVGYLVVWMLARVLGLVTNLLDKKIFKKNQED